MDSIRVLNILPEKNYKEAEAFIMNIYRNIEREKVQFDFLIQGEHKETFNNEIELLGGHVFKMNSLRDIGAHKYRKAAREFFNNHKYDIVHCYLDSFSGVILSEAKKTGVKIRIAHMYDKDIKFNKRGYFRFSVNKNSNYKFAYSKEEGNLFFGEFEKFTLLRNVIDLDKFSYDKKIRNNLKSLLNLRKEKIIGYINKSNSYENNKKVLSLFNEVIKIHKNSKLILVLNNDYRLEVENDINELGLKNDVILVSNNDFLDNDIMQVFDVMLFMSDKDTDNLLVKAQENDLPCIVFNDIDNDLDLNLSLVYRFNFVKSEKIIAENILQKSALRNSVKQDYIKYKMNKLGYDSKREAKILENFYLNAYKNLGKQK